jgi:subtilisin family serine protease
MPTAFRTISILGVAALFLSACGGGGGGGVTPNPTPTPTKAPQSAACPSSGSLPSSASSRGVALARRMPAPTASVSYVPGVLAITYASAARADAVDRTLNVLGAIHPTELTFTSTGLRTRIVHVDPARTDDVMSSLRATSGIRSVSRIAYRQRTAIASNDPYYVGFGTSAPYFESSSLPGQWDMHAINAAAGWNDVSSSAPVVGSSAPIAIVDTGVDVTHPEMTGGKIIRTQCFVTFPSSAAQSTGVYVTDTDGHGTNVAGIASGNTGNAFGFASAGFDAKIMAYRIFPTEPSGGCESSNPPDQCFSNSGDEATAITDAVNHGAKVINLSLGGSQPCTSSDPEYQAVENAIAHNVVVVAAAGNGDSNGVGLAELDCPANDPGVIAVGASAIDDAIPTATSLKVASYSNYVPNGGNGRYLVAPGGDPSGSNDTDNLHWIEHIYSSTAVVQGTCTPDFHSSSSTGDCRILIAGTSQSTPHVAGVAALILKVRPNYTPAQVAAALCNSARDIGDAKQGCGQLNAQAAVSYALAH